MLNLVDTFTIGLYTLGNMLLETYVADNLVAQCCLESYSMLLEIGNKLLRTEHLSILSNKFLATESTRVLLNHVYTCITQSCAHMYYSIMCTRVLL